MRMHPLVILSLIFIIVLSVKPISAAYTGSQLSFDVSGVENLRMDKQDLKANVILEVVNPTGNELTIDKLNLKISSLQGKQIAHIKNINGVLKIAPKTESKLAVPFKVNISLALVDYLLPGFKSFFKSGFDRKAFINEMPHKVKITGWAGIESLPNIPVDIVVDVKKQLQEA